MIKAIDSNQLLTQMRALQLQVSQQNDAIAQNNDTKSNNVDFTNVIKSAIDKVNATQKTSGELKTAFEMGDPKVSLVDTMIASQKAEVAFQATMQVRNKFIQAYQEVMRMSI